MATTTLTKHIAAPPAAVFALFSDFENAPGRVSGITKLEIVTPGPVGVGTRFKETRKMWGKECTEEMQITAFEPNKSYEITCGSCGAEFRCEFRFMQDNQGTRVELEMKSKALSFFAKLMTPLAWLMMGPMKKCIDKDMEDLKKAAEGTLVAQGA